MQIKKYVGENLSDEELKYKLYCFLDKHKKATLKAVDGFWVYYIDGTLWLKELLDVSKEELGGFAYDNGEAVFESGRTGIPNMYFPI